MDNSGQDGVTVNKRLAAEVVELKSFIAQTLPFLKEAWGACFDGKKEKLLSAEERGMGMLLGAFQDIADGKPPLPPGVITTKEATKQEHAAIKWAYDLFGSPNELKEPYKSWVGVGQTCADGLVRAVDVLEELKLQLIGTLTPDQLATLRDYLKD